MAAAVTMASGKSFADPTGICPSRYSQAVLAGVAAHSPLLATFVLSGESPSFFFFFFVSGALVYANDEHSGGQPQAEANRRAALLGASKLKPRGILGSILPMLPIFKRMSKFSSCGNLILNVGYV